MSIDPAFVVAAVMLSALLWQLRTAFRVWHRLAGSGPLKRFGVALLAFLIPGFISRLLFARLVNRLLRAAMRGVSGRGRLKKASTEPTLAPAALPPAKQAVDVAALTSADLATRFGAAEAVRKLNIPKVVE